MARPPKNYTPLRRFREETGHSQKTFANAIQESLHVSPATYKAYEEGARPLPLKAAVQLMLLYGVDPDSIMQQGGTPKDIAGHPYSRSSFDTWPGERIYETTVLPVIVQRTTDRLIRMLLAARRAGRFTLALQMLEESLEEMQKYLLLEQDYGIISGTKKPFKKWSPIKVYTAGAPVRVPERADFPLAESALRTMQDLIEEKKICRGGDVEEFDLKERQFFSPDRQP